MTTPESRLHREEWDFEAFAARMKDRLDFVFGYEFGREVAHIIEAHEEDRRANRRIDEMGNWHCVLVKRDASNAVEFDDCFLFDDPDRYCDGFIPTDKVPHFEFEVVDAPVGFPDTPYLLLIPPHELGSRSRFPKMPKRLGFSSAYPDQGGWVNGNREFVSPDEVYNIHIEWDLSDKEIQEDFARWLSRVVPRPRPAIERRGQGGGRELMADLKALGAWRLLKVHQDDFRAARTFTQQQGKPAGLFVGEKDWRNAWNRAQAIIDDWTHRDVCG